MIDGQKSPCDEGVVQAGEDAAPCAEHVKPWVLVATILGSSLAFIVGSVVNVALPAIQTGLGATAMQMQWVLNAYLLFLGALILAGGSAGDQVGRRRVFVLGILIFLGASVWCGLAPSARQLILARGVQGIGGAMLVPSSLSIISATFPKEERGKAIGTWAGFSALTTAFGPVLGGWLVDALSWRWVFFVVVPLGLLTLAITLWRVPESRDEHRTEPLDVAGALLATFGLGALTYGLIASSGRGWIDPWVLGALLGGTMGLVAFWYVEARKGAPMMPPELFRSRTFSGANAMTLLLYFALNGALFFLPFNLIQVRGYSAMSAGAAFLPFTLLLGGLSRWAGGLLEQYGAKKPLVAGPAVAGVGLVLFALPGMDGSYWTTYFPAMLVLGLGMVISIAPLTTVVMNAVPDDRAGVASGINNAASRIAGLLAIAILGIVALNVFGRALDRQMAALEVPPAVEAAMQDARQDLAAADVPPGVEGATRQALEQAIDASFLQSFRVTMGIAAGLAFLSALCAGVLVEEQEASGEATGHPKAEPT